MGIVSRYQPKIFSLGIKKSIKRFKFGEKNIFYVIFILLSRSVGAGEEPSGSTANGFERIKTAKEEKKIVCRGKFHMSTMNQ